MTVTVKNEPVLVRPAGSHWLELEQGIRRKGEPFSREELHPILELDVPRVGFVRAQFEANRYVASSYDERTGESSPLWSEWRIFLRDVRTPDEERPDLPHLGRTASGVGEATWRAITRACEPLILAWLETDDYRASRQSAAAYAAKREIDAPAAYRLVNVEQTLALVRDHLSPDDAERLARAVDLLEQAAALLDGEAPIA